MIPYLPEYDLSMSEDVSSMEDSIFSDEDSIPEEEFPPQEFPPQSRHRADDYIPPVRRISPFQNSASSDYIRGEDSRVVVNPPYNFSTKTRFEGPPLRVIPFEEAFHPQIFQIIKHFTAIVYGIPRSGKTSFLREIARSHGGEIYVVTPSVETWSDFAQTQNDVHIVPLFTPGVDTSTARGCLNNFFRNYVALYEENQAGWPDQHPNVLIIVDDNARDLRTRQVAHYLGSLYQNFWHMRTTVIIAAQDYLNVDPATRSLAGFSIFTSPIASDYGLREFSKNVQLPADISRARVKSKLNTLFQDKEAFVYKSNIGAPVGCEPELSDYFAQANAFVMPKEGFVQF